MGSALLIIDVQNDFCAGGALAVTDGNAVVPPINRLQGEFPLVLATQDWHPADHASFAANHAGAEPFSTTEMPYGTQVLWPTHCVQGSAGARMHPDLAMDRVSLIVRKGTDPAIDSYSAFFENDRTTPTGLAGYLRDKGVTALTMAGLATDFCVGYSALDARRLGFAVTVATGACRAIDLDGSLEASMRQMRESGVVIA